MISSCRLCLKVSCSWMMPASAHGHAVETLLTAGQAAPAKCSGARHSIVAMRGERRGGTCPALTLGLGNVRDVLANCQAHVAHVGGVIVLPGMHKHAPRGCLKRAVYCEGAHIALPACR